MEQRDVTCITLIKLPHPDIHNLFQFSTAAVVMVMSQPRLDDLQS
jgi:hypothetical protein